MNKSLDQYWQNTLRKLDKFTTEKLKSKEPRKKMKKIRDSSKLWYKAICQASVTAILVK